MHVKSRAFVLPRLDGRVLVRSVVVGDQIQHLFLGGSAVDLTQELQPLHVGVALLVLAHDLAVEDFERGTRRGDAVALASRASHGGYAPLLHEQSRGPIPHPCRLAPVGSNANPSTAATQLERPSVSCAARIRISCVLGKTCLTCSAVRT